MKKLILIAAVLMVTACGTLHEQTLEYCDTTSSTFIGIKYSQSSECRGMSNSGSGEGIITPEQLPQ